MDAVATISRFNEMLKYEERWTADEKIKAELEQMSVEERAELEIECLKKMVKSLESIAKTTERFVKVKSQ